MSILLFPLWHRTGLTEINLTRCEARLNLTSYEGPPWGAIVAETAASLSQGPDVE